jgi:hypothetical protein
MKRLRVGLRRMVMKSWLLSRCYYRCRGARLLGRPQDEIWYFAYDANMDDSTFRIRRGIEPLDCCSGPHQGLSASLQPQWSAPGQIRTR